MSYEYAYLTLIFFLGLIWLALFLARNDTKSHQTLMSLFTAPLGLTQYWFFQDYWQPTYFLPSFYIGNSHVGIEELIFAFFIGGIVAVLYEVFFHKKYHQGNKRGREAIAVGVIIIAFVFFLLLRNSGLGTIWASSIAAISASLFLIYLDQDLRIDCVVSAAVMVVIIIGVYLAWFAFFPDAVSELWVADGLTGVAFLGIPIEELVWYVSWSMFGGIFYEFWHNAGKYIDTRKNKARKKKFTLQSVLPLRLR